MPSKKFFNKEFENKEFEKMKKKLKGRPSLYSDELADRICQAIANTPKSLFDILEENKEFPDYTTINRWVAEKPIFREKYERAKIEQLHANIVFTNKIADDLTDKLDNCEQLKASAYVAAAKLRIESRQWQASRLLPRYYSDKARQEEAEEALRKMTDDQIKDKLTGILTGVEERIKKNGK